MPRYPIDRATNFIVEDESWSVIEYDHTSVPGIIYLSLTEGKINSIYDDVQNDLADLDKLAKYELSMPPITQIFHLGDHIEPKFTLTKNGQPSDVPIDLLTSDKKIVRNIDGELIAVGKGQVTIIAQLKDYPDIKQEIVITVGEEEKVFSAYIEGADKIRLDRESDYVLQGTEELTATPLFTIDNEQLAKIVAITSTGCIIHANANNKLGTIILSAQYNDKVYTKTISIIPLW